VPPTGWSSAASPRNRSRRWSGRPGSRLAATAARRVYRSSERDADARRQHGGEPETSDRSGRTTRRAAGTGNLAVAVRRSPYRAGRLGLSGRRHPHLRCLPGRLTKGMRRADHVEPRSHDDHRTAATPARRTVSDGRRWARADPSGRDPRPSLTTPEPLPPPITPLARGAAMTQTGSDRPPRRPSPWTIVAVAAS